MRIIRGKNYRMTACSWNFHKRQSIMQINNQGDLTSQYDYYCNLYDAYVYGMNQGSWHEPENTL